MPTVPARFLSRAARALPSPYASARSLLPGAALVVALAALVASSPGAWAASNVYKSNDGLSQAANAALAPAGLNLNPFGSGQLLVGTYYDVRPIAGDAQINNVQILNTNTNNPGLPPCTELDRADGIAGGGACYEPAGGILAKVRLRESKTSQAILDFVVALSCGEVWAGRITRNATTGLPQVSSSFPIASEIDEASVTTAPLIRETPLEVAAPGLPSGLEVADLQRGHFEVIALEALPCEPQSGALDLAGNTWTRIGETPSNGLSGQVFLVRAAAGVSHSYEMPAIANFAPYPNGPVTPANLLDANEPKYTDCLALDQSRAFLGANQCVQAANFSLSKSRLLAQYDVEDGTSGRTLVVVTLPTKYENCSISEDGWAEPTTANGPFDCGPREEISCTLFDRLENFVREDFVTPPPQAGICTLDRAVNVIQIVKTAADSDARADVLFATSDLPAGESGWLDLDLARDADNDLIHGEIAAPLTVNHLGMFLAGYEGLPTAGLVLQEFFNGNVGGTYGNTVAPAFEQTILRPIDLAG